DQLAYSFVDSRTIDCFLTSLYRPYEASSIGEVASMLGLDPGVVTGTVRQFNASIVAGGTFDPGTLDSCHTQGLDPPKSHWAVPIETPPFYGYPLRPGITFTYLGLAVDRCCRVQMSNGSTVENLFAAGGIMAGDILRGGRLGELWRAVWTGFGRI